LNLHKSGIIKLAAARTVFTYTETERVLNAFFLLIYETLSEGGTVNISGFGKFRVHETKGSMGVNPRNPTEPMIRPSRKTPKFTAGEAMKKAVNK
jgi:DNA-binding protein HU-beta